jgi:hypothetical protein
MSGLLFIKRAVIRGEHSTEIPPVFSAENLQLVQSRKSVSFKTDFHQSWTGVATEGKFKPTIIKFVHSFVGSIGTGA